MTYNLRSIALITAIIFGVGFFSGCGGGVKPVKNAKKEIQDAENEIASAASWQAKAEYDMALAALKRAEDVIKVGKSNASGAQEKKLKSLEDDIVLKIASINAAKTIPPKQVAPQKPPDADVVSLDPEEAKKREAEAKAKKEAIEVEKRKVEMAAREKAIAAVENKPIPKKSDDDDATTTPNASPKSNDGENNPAIVKDAPKPKGIGPFPAITANSPALDIVKITSKGQYAVCFFQVYNKNADGKRISAISVVFKDKDNQPINIPVQTVITYPYSSKFSMDKKDLTVQDIEGFTMGSVAVDGGSGAQFVAIGESERASAARKAGVQVVYQDGSSDADSGPSAVEPSPPEGFKIK